MSLTTASGERRVFGLVDCASRSALLAGNRVTYVAITAAIPTTVVTRPKTMARLSLTITEVCQCASHHVVIFPSG